MLFDKSNKKYFFLLWHTILLLSYHIKQYIMLELWYDKPWAWARLQSGLPKVSKKDTHLFIKSIIHNDS